MFGAEKCFERPNDGPNDDERNTDHCRVNGCVRASPNFWVLCPRESFDSNEHFDCLACIPCLRKAYLTNHCACPCCGLPIGQFLHQCMLDGILEPAEITFRILRDDVYSNSEDYEHDLELLDEYESQIEITLD